MVYCMGSVVSIDNIVFEEMSNAYITTYWFMYGIRPTQRIFIDGKCEYILTIPYDISSYVYVGLEEKAWNRDRK